MIFLNEAIDINEPNANASDNPVKESGNITKAQMMEPYETVIERLEEETLDQCNTAIKYCQETKKKFDKKVASYFTMQTEHMNDSFYNRFIKEIKTDFNRTYFTFWDQDEAIALFSARITGGPKMGDCQSWEDLINYICIYRDRFQKIINLFKQTVGNKHFKHKFYEFQLYIQQDTPILLDKVKMMTGFV